MIEFAPHSPWPKRLRILMYVMLGLTVISGVGNMFGRRWAANQGGDAESKTKLSIYALQAALKARHWVIGRYPTNEEGLYSMLKEHKGLPIRIQDLRKTDNHLDGWKQEFQYRCPGVHNKNSYDLWSLGEDGEDGTRDDITNW